MEVYHIEGGAVGTNRASSSLQRQVRSELQLPEKPVCSSEVVCIKTPPGVLAHSLSHFRNIPKRWQEKVVRDGTLCDRQVQTSLGNGTGYWNFEVFRDPDQLIQFVSARVRHIVRKEEARKRKRLFWRFQQWTRGKREFRCVIGIDCHKELGRGGIPIGWVPARRRGGKKYLPAYKMCVVLAKTEEDASVLITCFPALRF